MKNLKVKKDGHWDFIKKCINSHNLNSNISKYEYAHENPETSVSFVYYCVKLLHIGVLERSLPGTFKIIQHIPNEMTNKMLLHFETEPSWKSWFMKIENRVEEYKKGKR